VTEAIRVPSNSEQALSINAMSGCGSHRLTNDGPKCVFHSLSRRRLGVKAEPHCSKVGGPLSSRSGIQALLGGASEMGLRDAVYSSTKALLLNYRRTAATHAGV